MEFVLKNIDRINAETIEHLNIDVSLCNDWIKESFLLKESSILPAKTPIRLSESVFITTMPCAIPSIGIGGVKIVSRYPNRMPSVDSMILLFRLSDGKVFAEMDGNLITSLRTGAAAALSVNLFAKKDFKTIGFVGLGNIARWTLKCLSKIYNDECIKVNLLEYKNHADVFQSDFADYKNIIFNVYRREEERREALPLKFINDSDVLISCVTIATNFFADEKDYPDGILLVPVHTRGFQNCDTKFDKIFGDDTEHLKHFEFFERFRSFSEIADVLKDQKLGRASDNERIIAYSVGISLHDVLFAWKIYNMIKK